MKIHIGKLRGSASLAAIASCQIGPQIFFAPPDEGGNPGGDPPAGDPPEGGNPGGDPPADDPPTPYFPDGLPDHLKGENDKETLDKVFAENKSYRDKQANQGTVPKDAVGYSFEFESEDAKAMFDLEAESTKNAVGMFKEVAHEHGLTEDAFKAVPKFLEKAVEAGLIPKQQSPDDVLSSLAPDDFKGTPEEKLAQGAQRMTAALNHVDAMLENKRIDDGVANELKMMAGSKDGVRALEMVMTTITKTAETGGNGGSADVTADSLRERMADPKNDRTSKDYDEKFAAETKQQYKDFYG